MYYVHIKILIKIKNKTIIHREQINIFFCEVENLHSLNIRCQCNQAHLVVNFIYFY